MIEIGRISFGWIIGLFVIYLISHVCIGINLKQIEDSIKEEARNVEKEKKLKNFKLLFKWWPAFYVIFVVVVIYIM